MPRADRTADAIALLAKIARQNNVDVKTLRSKEKRARADIYVKIRRDFCVRGRALKISTIELGIALDRDYTTVSYHTNPEMRAVKAARNPIYRARIKQQRNSERAAFA